ncbi:MAG TPA: hypothetical protein VF884_12435 [Nitrososphaeraceae archaeon]
MELEKELSESQGAKLKEYLDRGIHNKLHLHPSDYRRAAVILYRANQLGYTSIGFKQLLSGGKYSEYSDMTIESLQHMSDAFTDLMYGSNNYENEELKNLEL